MLRTWSHHGASRRGRTAPSRGYRSSRPIRLIGRWSASSVRGRWSSWSSLAPWSRGRRRRPGRGRRRGRQPGPRGRRCPGRLARRAGRPRQRLIRWRSRMPVVRPEPGRATSSGAGSRGREHHQRRAGPGWRLGRRPSTRWRRRPRRAPCPTTPIIPGRSSLRTTSMWGDGRHLDRVVVDHDDPGLRPDAGAGQGAGHGVAARAQGDQVHVVARGRRSRSPGPRGPAARPAGGR